ncbi:hypothetical protein C8J55DRAFT_491910 [Lentinula edodes]|uniref:Uncharacterized protein n=1 Tax=Lentinula lateritia TaxID=40482 RepID=A0A9W8ZYA8_9AGAR|nr:hypothetical protein C8J55DRAFT_491910 [Lentinula edodes]
MYGMTPGQTESHTTQTHKLLQGSSTPLLEQCQSATTCIEHRLIPFSGNAVLDNRFLWELSWSWLCSRLRDFAGTPRLASLHLSRRRCTYVHRQRDIKLLRPSDEDFDFLCDNGFGYRLIVSRSIPSVAVEAWSRMECVLVLLLPYSSNLGSGGGNTNDTNNDDLGKQMLGHSEETHAIVARLIAIRVKLGRLKPGKVNVKHEISLRVKLARGAISYTVQFADANLVLAFSPSFRHWTPRACMNPRPTQPNKNVLCGVSSAFGIGIGPGGFGLGTTIGREDCVAACRPLSNAK